MDQHQASQIEVNDLDGIATELNEEELEAVSGARMMTCLCGKPARDDDWIM